MAARAHGVQTGREHLGMGVRSFAGHTSNNCGAATQLPMRMGLSHRSAVVLGAGPRSAGES
eukprot:325512-Alexandrium_andersonii.AAC.1